MPFGERKIFEHFFEVNAGAQAQCTVQRNLRNQAIFWQVISSQAFADAVGSTFKCTVL
jgi:hypothetical protein